MINNLSSFSVIILTYNDECQISEVLSDLKNVERVLVVDSFSTDKTTEIVRSFHRELVQHEFENQAKQVNWAIRTHYASDDWILRLDSDERVSSKLLLEINDLILNQKVPFVGYIKRNMYWMNTKLKFAGIHNHFIGRLWQPKFAYYEEVTEEHLIHECNSIKLKHEFYENNKKNLIEYFIEKHIQTAIGEVAELKQNFAVENSFLFSSHGHLVRRWLKIKLYNSLPLFIRPVCYFLFRYIIKLGFLDGKAGFSFCFFQAFFYRMLIDQLYDETNNKGE